MATAQIIPTVSSNPFLGPIARATLKGPAKKKATTAKKTTAKKKTKTSSSTKRIAKTSTKTKTPAKKTTVKLYTKGQASRFRTGNSVSPSLKHSYTPPSVSSIMSTLDAKVPPRSDIPLIGTVTRDSVGEAKAATMKAIAEKRRQDRKELIENQVAIAKRFGLQYLHIGKTTFAYVERTVAGHRKGSVVRFATSRCHPSDSFSKGLGAAYAAKNFAEGHWVELKSPLGQGTARDFLTAIGGVSEHETVATEAVFTTAGREYTAKAKQIFGSYAGQDYGFGGKPVSIV